MEPVNTATPLVPAAVAFLLWPTATNVVTGTRSLVAIGYLALALILTWSVVTGRIMRSFDIDNIINRRPFAILAAGVAAIWSAWYFWLAIVNPAVNTTTFLLLFHSTHLLTIAGSLATLKVTGVLGRKRRG